ncbi:MAG: hypothetical protein IJT30_06815 [Muribaculaceae bacterium]|nr:hypothetical protein [Muribaculaceae bacterium]
MPRYIANYTILPSATILRNHVTTVDNRGHLLALKPINDELAYTTYVPHPMLVLPSGCHSTVNQLAHHARNLDDLRQFLRQLNLKPPLTGDSVLLYQIDTATGRITPLCHE